MSEWTQWWGRKGKYSENRQCHEQVGKYFRNRNRHKADWKRMRWLLPYENKYVAWNKVGLTFIQIANDRERRHVCATRPVTNLIQYLAIK
jgi:hypothetical protein